MKSQRHLKPKKISTDQQVFTLIQRGPVTTAPDIVARSGLSRPTVDAVLGRLEQMNLVRRLGQAGSRGGRRATRFGPDTQAHLFLGLAFHVPETALVLMNFRGEVVWRHEMNWTGRSTQKAISHLADALELGRREAGTRGGRVLQTTMAMPGVLSADGRTSRTILRIPGWHDVPVTERIRTQDSEPVVLMRYLEAYSLGLASPRLHSETESRRGPELALQIGPGVGLAVAGLGESWGGINAGEFGQTALLVEGEVQTIETLFSDKAHLKRYRLAGGATGKNAANVYARATSKDDQAAARAFIETGRYLELALSNLIHLFDPDRITITGAVSCAPKSLLEAVFTRARERVGGHALIQIEASPTDHAKAAEGAAHRALSEGLERMLTTGATQRSLASATKGEGS